MHLAARPLPSRAGAFAQTVFVTQSEQKKKSSFPGLAGSWPNISMARRGRIFYIIGAMTERSAPHLAKWPFLAGDLILLGLAAVILQHYPHPLERGTLLLLAGCVLAGAWMAILPFLVEYRASVKFAEADALATTVEQINNLRTLTNQISFATAQWQVVQEQSGKTVTTAREITERISAEAQAFADSLAKANDAERGHLRLEVDKLRRGEGEWVESLVRVFDHIYAIYLAGSRSKQTHLKQQFGQFQNACRDAVRRLGFVPFEAEPGGSYDALRHQVVDPDTKPEDGAIVAETVATGYSYQGQMLRQALVSLKVEGTQPDEEGGPEQLSLREQS